MDLTVNTRRACVPCVGMNENTPIFMQLPNFPFFVFKLYLTYCTYPTLKKLQRSVGIYVLLIHRMNLIIKHLDLN